MGTGSGLGWILDAAIALGVAVALALAVYLLSGAVGRRVAARNAALDEGVLLRARAPLALLAFALVSLSASVRMQARLPELVPVLRHALVVLAIGAVTWAALVAIRLFGQAITRRYDVSVADNLEARRVHTQVTVISRTLMTLVVLLGVAAALMTFPRIRELGTSLLVSAGFAGLVIGLAARPLLENLIHGLQLAFTQPIRLDDVVIVDGEWGRIEEITTTYVVVRIWDDRRLICPFSKFITESFQNWTRRTSELLGTVFVYADYRLPVAPVREALRQICSEARWWDGRVCVLQVTNATDRAVELRALVSARDASDAWELRVFVRERLVAFLQENFPEHLPRTRVSLEAQLQGGEGGEQGSVARGPGGGGGTSGA